MKEKLQDDLKVAMKSGERLRVMTLRGVLTEITRLEKDVRRPANNDEIIQIFKRERARRDEAIEFAQKGRRPDLVEQNQTEAAILDTYLPAALDPSEIQAVIAAQLAAGADKPRTTAESSTINTRVGRPALRPRQSFRQCNTTGLTPATSRHIFTMLTSPSLG